MVPRVSAMRRDSEDQIVRAVGFVVGVCLCVVLGLGFAGKALKTFTHRPRLQIQGKINPNRAPTASLARLPSIGLTRANAIVVHRNEFTSQGGEGAAFHRPEDLRVIPGIGPRTVEDIRPWLRFGSSDGEEVRTPETSRRAR